MIKLCLSGEFNGKFLLKNSQTEDIKSMIIAEKVLTDQSTSAHSHKWFLALILHWHFQRYIKIFTVSVTEYGL